jgi:hypothetical protein
VARGKATFKQSDATRAMKSALAAGLEVTRVEIEPSGKIVMVTGKPEGATVSSGKGWEDAR